MVNSGMILIKESFLDKLLTRNLPPIGDLTIKTLTPDELTYFNNITNNINNQLKVTIDWLDTEEAKDYFYHQRNLRTDFFRKIENEMSDILNQNASSVDELCNAFYKAGQKVGFTQMSRNFIFSQADANSLLHVQNYNFGLIRNVSEDLKTSIREEIWRGVAEGKGAYEVARNLRELPLKPLRNGVSAHQRSIMIARTEVMRAKNTGALMAYSNYGVDKVTVPGIGDAEECEDCLDVVNGGPYTIDEASDLLPVHPRCRHHVAPYMDALIEPVGLDYSDYVDMTTKNTTNILNKKFGGVLCEI